MAESYATFGNYLLLKQRSEDGLGTLWRAGEMERIGFKRIVWLRRFDGAGLDRAAIEAEAAVVEQLGTAFKATNVARNSAFGSEEGVPYLAFDYVPGQPLDQLLDRVGSDQFPIAIDNALLLAEKISAALAAALAIEVRGEPLVHGFLVPHLILVGNDGEAMVEGFGLTKGLLANLDRTAVRELAAPYLAPEVLTTYGTSRRADAYSLGAILYQLLCGEPLPADPAARAAVLEAPQLALDEGPVPDDILAVLRRSLAERPEERYSSAVDFKRDLEKLLYGGAYSPTTFNLALFMDRMYRQEIEEEDRELQQEKGIDVAQYYRPPKSAESAAAAVAPAATGSRTGLYVALGAVAVLLAVVVYLLFLRPSVQQPQDVAGLVQTEVERQLAEREAQLSAELEETRKETEALRQQLAKKQTGATGTQVSPEAQRQAEALRRQIARQEEEQRRREAELRKLQQQRAAAEATKAAQATEVPAVPTLGAATPTPAPEPTAEVVAAVQPTAAPAVPTTVATKAPPAAALPPAGLGAAVKEGDMVDFTLVSTPPEVLVSVKPTFGRAATIAKARGVVILSALVNHRGAVEDVKILRSFPAGKLGIDEACMEAVRKYRFRPATKDGVNVKTWTTVTLPIDLSRGR